ncbi:MAG: peroxiredoxin [Salaquimonas sp.]|nr:peroxiredoxin [Salaquimonas sp.]
MAGYTDLPADLPVPEDDGAATHLAGMTLPSVSLSATDGSSVDLSKLAGTLVLYAYPMTGVPGAPLPEGWDEIPGARGCTPQSCAFRDHVDELRKAGADHVFGLSTQTTGYQREAADRLHLPFPLLSDNALRLKEALDLPVFEASVPGQNTVLLKRLAFVARGRMIVKVFYPVFPPDQNATDVLDWLLINPT